MRPIDDRRFLLAGISFLEFEGCGQIVRTPANGHYETAERPWRGLAIADFVARSDERGKRPVGLFGVWRRQNAGPGVIAVGRHKQLNRPNTLGDRRLGGSKTFPGEQQRAERPEVYNEPRQAGRQCHGKSSLRKGERYY